MISYRIYAANTISVILRLRSRRYPISEIVMALKKAVIIIQIEEIAFVIYVTAQTLKMNSILFLNVLSIMILELIISKTIITEDPVCLNSFSY